ncbi:MAG: sodium:solute symporter family protein [Candidatus Sericytochromatia bacterium]|nr:sodium:solute symporter family protein [Candidatus Sericytochromatia bacterium]
MHPIDFVIVVLSFVGMVAFGLWIKDRQTSVSGYFVGDRNLGATHIGLSIVATDVGGGFSIGLGGLGFTMGLSGAWLLFTGLLGAWLSAVFLIPKVKPLADRHRFLTFPDLLGHRFGPGVAALAAVISGIAYVGFTGSQLLAGGKLAASAFGLPLHPAVWGMAGAVILYTALGGLRAVILTDTIQWGILLVGLALVALPLGYVAVGGIEGLRQALPPAHFDPLAVTPDLLAQWAISIVPVWFVGMTLYQRLYAVRDERTARRAWLVAGLLEWPLMAFLGVILGMFARVMFPAVDPEMAMPKFVAQVLPTGAAGLVMAAYLAAIMSTADSCLLAAAGHLVNDLYHKVVNPLCEDVHLLRLSRETIMVLGLGSVAFALHVPGILQSMLLAYGFMVAGLLFPTLAALYWPRATARGALWSMLAGGGMTLLVTAKPTWFAVAEPLYLGLPAGALALVLGSLTDRTAKGRLQPGHG